MKTLLSRVSFEETINKSRFVTHASCVSSERETLEFWESVADPAASHNCWAWRVDLRSRSNDDGEPSGSAGRPILSVLEGRDLDNVMVVVTRYYGGTNLGIGGLVRAYSGGASKCLDQAQLVDKLSLVVATVETQFDQVATVYHLMDQFEGEKLREHYRESGLSLQFKINARVVSDFETELNNQSRGRARLKIIRDI